MAIALVGSAGAISTVATASITPAFGQATTAGNLLIARVTDNVGGIAIATTSTGWTQAVQAQSGANDAAVFYKMNCGASETAPTFTATGATVMFADLTEWSGAATSAALDQSGTGGGAANPTAGCTANDTNTADLAVGCAMFTNSKTATYTVSNTWTPASGTATATQNTGATKQLNCFMGSAYLLNGHGGAAHDTVTFTVTPSTGAFSSEACAVASFLPLTAAATGVIAPPIVADRLPWHRKGVVWYRKTPPVFTAPTQQPVVTRYPAAGPIPRHRFGVVWYRPVLVAAAAPVTHQPIVVDELPYNRHRRGVVWYRKTPPVFTAPNREPLVQDQYPHPRLPRAGRIVVLTPGVAPAPPPPAQKPLVQGEYPHARLPRRGVRIVVTGPTFVVTLPPAVHTASRHPRGTVRLVVGSTFVVTHQPIVVGEQPYNRHRRGVVWYRTTVIAVVVVVATQQPIVVGEQPYNRHRKGVIWWRPTPPVFKAPSPAPVVHSTQRHNRCTSIRFQGLPVAPTVTPAPIVRCPTRRNRGGRQVLHQLPQYTVTPTPIVRCLSRRNPGRRLIVYRLPSFVPATPQPIVKTRMLKRRGVATLAHLIPFIAPPFTIGTLTAADRGSNPTASDRGSGDTATSTGTATLTAQDQRTGGPS